LEPTPNYRPSNGAVVICSGGLDSTVLLYHVLQQHVSGESTGPIRVLSVNYGQRHKKELDFAVATAERLQLEHRVANLSAITHLLAGSSQTSDGVEVPYGHYAQENMKLTVVPNRNMIMLSIAAGWAISTKSEVLYYGVHTGDHYVYADCRVEFVESLAESIQLADEHTVVLLAPFATRTKADIVRRGAELGVPFEETWSCYKGGTYHCGRCGTCTERVEAFRLAGIEDPTLYDPFDTGEVVTNSAVQLPEGMAVG
jgi:7-cyano-7-deazaguanine synthase